MEQPQTQSTEVVPTTGGVGGMELAEVGERGSVEDTRLIELALKERWPIPDELRESVIKRLAKVVESKRAKTREVISASKALSTIDKLNIESRREGLDVILAERRIEHEQKVASTPQEVNVRHSGRLTICEDGDWYSNAHRLGAEAAQPHAAGADESGAV